MRAARLAKPVLISALAATLVLVALELGARRFENPFGVPQDRIEALRTHLHGGPPRYWAYPYVSFIPRNRSAWDPTRPVDWAFESIPDGALRIACLGGSTTAGGYPFHLMNALKDQSDEPLFVMNWGTSGWTTQETMVNYFINVQDYDPDIIVLHHAVNDVQPRRQAGFRSDYAHWRKSWEVPKHSFWTRLLAPHSTLYAAWFLKSSGYQPRIANFANQPPNWIRPCRSLEDLPARSEDVFARNIRTVAEYATLRGTAVVLVTMPYNAKFASDSIRDGLRPVWALAMEQHNQILRDLARELRIELIDMEAWGMQRPDIQDHFTDSVHMVEEGIRKKAEMVAQSLLERGVLGERSGR